MAITVQLFPLWAILFSAFAFVFPIYFVDLKSMIIPLLMVIMLTMGLTLTPKDFLRATENKKAIFIGILLQFSVMPILAFLLAKGMNFDTQSLIGLVLVGTVAGGTASNVLCYLAKGDVALSITMTAISTLIGVILTPVLTTLLIGELVNIPIINMLVSLFKIVLLPVTLGVILNLYCNKLITKSLPALPMLSMGAIVFIIAIVVALNQAKLESTGLVIMLAVILHNGIGLLLGYFVPKRLGCDEQVCRTIAFEVGMQNSGLAVALAMKFFTPSAAVAGSLFSIWHNVSGSLLASIWQKSAVPNITKK
ncbi:bile acid:sodium symporter family protein [Pseudoalteromonas sp. MMG013]|uniref:bile acid:sodium symporter family protein n=1 Tax=Pseudoalteromonas sp. MMG013 TaxID=2822687 RepID=UPI001B373861|nr:bile acid:sodium symporter family protein [Pseudoalteromonas sp. MMG013]MBQ4863900.1 bile acid:sodium symporter family protein [Pseudoalteromonas sp. MMG013]